MRTLRKIREYYRVAVPLGLVAMFIGSSCEPEFDVNADYQRVPIVVGILDDSDSIHIIKINRSFLGSGSALDYARIADSSYYDALSARVTEYVNGNETRHWDLMDTLVPNKESGVFFYPEQKVYYFMANDLVEGADYVLTADLDEGNDNITAETQTIDGAAFYYSTSVSSLSMAYQNSTEVDNYPTPSMSYLEAANGSLYELDLVFKYSEEDMNGDTVHHSITMSLDQERVDIPTLGQRHDVELDGRVFFQFIGNSIPVDPNVVRRRVEGVDLILSVAHEDLDLFMQLSEPSTSIVQTKPEYTNVEGGRGIFSSKSTVTVLDKEMNTYTLKELCTGQYTAALGFCSHHPFHSGENWYCP